MFQGIRLESKGPKIKKLPQAYQYTLKVLTRKEKYYGRDIKVFKGMRNILSGNK